MTRCARRVVGAATATVLALGPGIPVGRVQTPTTQAQAEGRLVDRAAASGLAVAGKTWAARALDADRDGDEDLWLGYHQQGAALMLNRGDGTYAAATTNAWPRVVDSGKVPDRHDCAFADVDGNGLLDSYCSAGRNLENRVKWGMDNELWLQTSPGRYRDVGTDWGLGDVCGRGRHVTFLDADGDRWPDLFLGNSMPRPGVVDPCDDPSRALPSEDSKLFLNLGGTGFREATGSGIGTAGPGERCAETLDLDGDGWTDLLACQLHDRVPRLWRNLAGTGFAEIGRAAGLVDRVVDATVVDLDRDGDPDVVTATDEGFWFQLNAGGVLRPRRLVGPVPTGTRGRSVAVGDVDGDRDLDVYGMVGAAAVGEPNPDDVVWVRSPGPVFTAVAVPPATGVADEVVAVRPWGPTRRSAFLVLNGGGEGTAPVGPVQLVSTP